MAASSASVCFSSDERVKKKQLIQRKGKMLFILRIEFRKDEQFKEKKENK